MKTICTVALLSLAACQRIEPPAPVVAQVPASVPAVVAQVLPPPPLPPVASNAAQLDRLAASPKPEDAWAAYRMARDCAYARRQESQGTPSSAAATCGDISPGQLVSRLQWLERAAEAGVHGAYLALVDEGPDGYRGLSTDAPDDAEYQRRVDRVQMIAARNADPDALIALSNRAENSDPPDPSAAAIYWLAWLAVTGRGKSAMEQAVTARLLEPFTTEQQTVIREQARRWATRRQ